MLEVDIAPETLYNTFNVVRKVPVFDTWAFDREVAAVLDMLLTLVDLGVGDWLVKLKIVLVPLTVELDCE